MPDKPILLIVDNVHAETMKRSAESLIGESVEIITSRDANSARDFLKEPRTKVAVIDLEIPERYSETFPSNAVGRELAQAASEEADRLGPGYVRLVIQCTVTERKLCASGTVNTGVWYHDRSYSLLFGRISKWLSSEKLWDDAHRGEWSATTQRFLCTIHATRHDILSPFLAIDCDLQTLAGLLERKKPDGTLLDHDEKLRDEVIKALSLNASHARHEAESALRTLKSTSDPNGDTMAAHLEHNHVTKDIWTQLMIHLGYLEEVSDKIAGTVLKDWEKLDTTEAIKFQQNLIDLRDDLETVVRYFDERFGKRTVGNP